jgi:NAD(P)-dependent dehydrogenase (short-subunit alcohol dehydrogenase family)
MLDQRAASGIGRAAAGLLPREGARVAVTDIVSEAGHEAAEQMSQLGGQARYWQLVIDGGYTQGHGKVV